MGNYDGYITIGTKIDTKGIESGLNNINKTVSTKTNALSNTISKTFNLLKNSIIGVGIVLALRAITKEMDNAITRLDTMKNFTNVMSNLGISGKDAEASIQRLSEKLKGLPTTIDAAALSVQRFASANNNVKASTEMFLALNNALLAGGASMQVQSTALEQLSQAYAKGKPDMMEWRSLMTAAPAQLQQIAKVMGYVNADQLGEALRNGSLSMNEFMMTMIKMNKQGMNGFKSFEEQARNATGGVRTSIENVKTALTRALANIMDAIGQSNIAGFFDGIRDAIDRVVPYIQAFVKVIVTAVSYVAALFGKKSKKQVDDTTSSVEGFGGSVSNATDNMDAATGSAGKLRKELKQLAAFDEMNVLQDNKTPSGGSGGGTSAGADMSQLADFDFDVDFDKVSSKMDELYEKMLKFAKWFTEDIDMKPLVNSLKNVGDALGYLKSGIGDWIYTFVRDFLKPLSTYTINNFLPQFFDAWANAMKKIDFDKINSAFSDLWKALEPVLEKIGNAILWLYEEIILPVGVFINNHILPLVTNVITTILKLINNVWEKVQPFFEELWNDYLKPAGEFIGSTLGPVFDWIGEGLKKIADNQIVVDILSAIIKLPFQALKLVIDGIVWAIQKIIEFVDILREKFEIIRDKVTEDVAIIKEAWGILADWFNDNVIEPIKAVFEPIIEFFSNLFNTAINNIKVIFENLITIAQFVWEGIKLAFSFVVNFFKDVWTQAKDKIEEVFGPIVDWIKEKWNNIKETFSKVKDFFKEQFEGALNNVKKVFSPIIDFFAGIWDKVTGKLRDFGAKVGETISGAFKGVVNGVLGAIENILNFPIRSINKLINVINKVPGINLGKLSTFSLPRLATGAIINQPGRGVMVGGNAIAGEAGREGILPLTDKQAMAELGREIGKWINIHATVPVNIGNRQVARVIQELNADREFAMNN